MESSRFLLVSVAMVILGLESGYCMQFVVEPHESTEGVTKRTTLGCRTDIDAPSKAQEILLVQITKGDDESVALLRSNGKMSYASEPSRRLEVVGEIDNMVIKGGYLNVTLQHPSVQHRGLYKCHVVYLNAGGVANHYSNEAYLDVYSKPSISHEHLKSLESSLLQAHRRIAALNETLSAERGQASAFSAAISHKTLIDRGATVIFDDVITQQGRGFNPKYGNFTAPNDGLYAFFLTLGEEGKAHTGFTIQVNGRRELARLFLGDEDKGDHSSASAVTTLKAGDEVKVVVSYKAIGTAYLYPNNYSVFSGFLVSPAI